MQSLERAFREYVRAQLARVLTQMDRDPDSPTFGCFDRNYWHYKIRDFPSAILQQGLFTLEALRNGTLQCSAPRETIELWCVGAVNALGRQVDGSGGVDEYYPWEHSYPASAFGLYAACRVLLAWRETAPHLLEQVDRKPLERLAAHVGSRVETQATNQQAAGLAGLALARKLGFAAVRPETVEAHADRLFASQHPEGWFDEYGGPDFGYLSVTMDALADYHDATGDPRALEALERAGRFLAQLVGADGRLPSTLNSRNTDYVVPYGLVRHAARNATASWLAHTLFGEIDSRDHPLRATDDRYHCHYIYASVIRSLPHLTAMQTPAAPAREESLWLDGCGLWVRHAPNGSWTAYVGARKGGMVRVHRTGLPPLVDHGWRVYRGGRTWSSNWQSGGWRVMCKKGDTADEGDRGDGVVRVEGSLQSVRHHVPGPVKHAALRVLAWLTRERLIPLLKRGMIFRPGKPDGPSFERVVEVSHAGVCIRDRLGAYPGAEAAAGPRQNLRHVASADSFSPEEWLLPLLPAARLPLDQELQVTVRWRPEEPEIRRETSHDSTL